MHKLLSIALRVTLALVVAATTATATDWTHWRGPGQDNRADVEGVFPADGFGLELAWKQELGSGYSGMVVAGDRLVTMFSDGEHDRVVTLDATTGERLWSTVIADTYRGHDGSDDGPVGSPLVVGDVVYGLGPSGHLFAVRLSDGAELWKTDIVAQLDAKAPFYGFATSPVAVGDVLVVQAGGPDGQAVAGLDRHTGALRWTHGEESIGYQSPVVAELARTPQVVIVGNTKVGGIDPATGELLWRHVHTEQARGDGSTQPVVIDGEHLLLNLQTEVVLLAVTRTDDGFAVTEAWRSSELKQSFAAPVHHDGTLYGFSGNFLTAVDAATGEKLWRSRPPGGNGLILVDDHLVVFSPRGAVVVAEATPVDYVEKARVQVDERGSYTWPVFANGHVYVRNLSHVAAVRPVAGTATAAKSEPTGPVVPGSELEKFVEQVERAEDKKALVDAFVAAHEHFPIVEGDDVVHFLYRGEVTDDIALQGSMAEFGAAVPMNRVDGTDLYYASFEVEPGMRWEYRFQIDFEETVPDPRNPHTVPALQGEMSELRMPGYEPPTHLAEPEGERGQIDEIELDSELLEAARRVRVYLPPGYAASEERYPVAIVHEGDDWLDLGHLTHTLDNEIGETIAPVIVAFVGVDPRTRFQELGGTGTEAYLRMIVEELVPHLDAHYRTIPKPEARALIGRIGGGVAAMVAVLQYPEIFSKVAMQSIYLPEPWDARIFAWLDEQERRPLTVYLDWNRVELASRTMGFDLGADSRRLAEALEARGIDYAGGEAHDAAGWGSWRARSAKFLAHLFPLEEE